MTALVQHLHAFVKDVELTEEEWERGDRVPHPHRADLLDDVRQEFILLSDVLGVSMLVETINHRAGGTSTESTVLGPFHMVESPPRELGDEHRPRRQGRALPGHRPGHRPRRQAAGRRDGRRVAGQRRRLLRRPAARRPAGTQPARAVHHRRRRHASGSARSCPRYYPIPDDGPVGELLAATGRHPNRPAHVHFIVAAAGLPAGDHASVRRRQPLHRLRRGLRGQGEPGPRVPGGRRPGAGRRSSGCANPFRTVHFDVALLARRPSRRPRR